jgi:UPF0755 protein
MRFLTKVILFLLLGILLLSGAFYVFIEQELNEPIKLSQSQLFTVEKGQSAGQVLHQLESKGWITHPKVWKVLFRFRPQLAQFKAGTYELLPTLTKQQLLELLISGKEKQFTISLVEGLRWREWLIQLKNHDGLIFDQSTENTITSLESDLPGHSLEGWLLPDTYHYVRGTNASTIISVAYQSMRLVLDSCWQERSLDVPYLSVFEGLILASIIEKETGIAEERSRIAGVFVNRLNNNMRLQTDPTVIYGLGENFDGDIKRKDLTTPTPYNTYVIKGLPPTAIAMPSKLAIEAAFQPMVTNELYFVAKGDGSHQFSHTLQEHNKAVRQYQLKKNN